MTRPAADYSGREWPNELYMRVSERLDQQGIRTDRIPDGAHLEVLETIFDSFGTPKNLTSQQRETFRVEDVGRFAEGYRNAIGEIDLKWNGRNEHERGVDALMQRYADGAEIKDYDLLIKNTWYSDPEYTPWTGKSELEDINLSSWRTLSEVLGSDADFIGVDLDKYDIDIYEVKKTNEDLSEGIRENKLRRAERQKELALDAINSNETDFDANSTVVMTHNLTSSEYPMPDVFEGDIHVTKDLSDKSEAVHEFYELFDQFAYKMSWNDLENVTRQRPDAAI